MIRRVLLVDDDTAVRDALCQTLELADLIPVPAASYIEAKDHITRGFDGVVLSDIRMPGKDGFALLDYAQKIDAELPVILLTGEGDVPMAVRGISAGAFDFLEKPCAPGPLIAVIERALQTRRLVLENRRLKRQIEEGDAASRMLVGQSQLARELRSSVRVAARAKAELLIHGEPGTGTSKVAEIVHLLSVGGLKSHFTKRAAAALQTPDDLAQALDAAAGGSLFLDEVAGLAPGVQFSLLDHLDAPDRQVRIISGTYRDLAEMADQGRFNPDLYYKLDVMRIRIPALRERAEDIPILFRHYVAMACEQTGLPHPEIRPDYLARLIAQEWPGNARALMNTAMRLVMGMGDDGPEADLGLVDQMAQVERSLLIAALRRHDGTATEAARSLKLPRKTFYDKLARHGIRPEDYRD